MWSMSDLLKQSGSSFRPTCSVWDETGYMQKFCLISEPRGAFWLSFSVARMPRIVFFAGEATRGTVT